MYQEEVIEGFKKIILPILEENNVELVGLSLVKAPYRPTLRLLVDKTYDGINLQV